MNATSHQPSSATPPPAPAAPAPAVSRRFGTHLRDGLAGLHPAYFAMVMATGIVSIACHYSNMRELASLLLAINVPCYIALWLLVVVRAVLYPRRVRADAGSHERGPGFFTMVAATGVLGSQLTIVAAVPEVGLALWWLCLGLWMVCTYTVFVLLCVADPKPSLEAGLNGGWLVSVVATQSVCMLGCVAWPQLGDNPDLTGFLLLGFWLAGGMLYIWMIALIFYRYMFFRFAPSDLMPPWWINMGAVAISALAGTALVDAAQHSPLLASLLPFIRGLTAMYWATATWWIPMLLILVLWRHTIRRFAFRYDPLYWGLVFPLGMYSVSTLRLADALDAPFLLPVSRAFVIVALVAWLLTFFGMLGHLLFTVLLALRAWRSTTTGLPRTRAGPDPIAPACGVFPAAAARACIHAAPDRSTLPFTVPIMVPTDSEIPHERFDS